MKNIILFLLVVLPFVAFAQTGGNNYQTVGLTSSRSFANSQVDTIPLGTGLVAHTKKFTIGGFDRVDFHANFADSVAADFYVDTQPIGGSVWTAAYTDSIQSGSAASLVKVINLRSSTVERLGGIGVYARIRIAFRATLNGVTTPTYTSKLYYK